MKVINKFFVIALLLSLILTMGAVAAKDNMTFEQSNTNMVSIETNNEPETKSYSNEEKLSDMKSGNDKGDKLSQNSNRGRGGVVNSVFDLNNGKFSDIQDLVDKAENGDTIRLSGKFKSEGKAITIDKKLNIISSDGVLLDGGGKSRIFIIESKAKGSTIKNIKFKDGYTTHRGGAIHLDASGVVIDSCIFINCSAGSGGAIATSTESAVESCIIRNSRFEKNNALDVAGAITYIAKNLDMSYCVFDSNYIKLPAGEEGGSGGVLQIGVRYQDNNCKITHCNFTNNYIISSHSNNYHGGVACLRRDVTFSDCYFKNNRAQDGGVLTFHDGGEIIRCHFIGNTAYGYGGVIQTAQSSQPFTISHSTFSDNSAKYGGAIYLNKTNLNIYNSTFTKNNADNGGAIYSNTNLNVHDSIFTRNSAIYGGAIYNDGNLNSNNCHYESNKAKSALLVDGSNSVIWSEDATIRVTFEGGNNIINAIWSKNPITLNGESVNPNNKIPSQTINLNIEDKSYSAVTGSDGVAVFKFNTINFQVKDYKGVASFKNSKNYADSTQRLDLKIEPKIETKNEIKNKKKAKKQKKYQIYIPKAKNMKVYFETVYRIWNPNEYPKFLYDSGHKKIKIYNYNWITVKNKKKLNSDKYKWFKARFFIERKFTADNVTDTWINGQKQISQKNKLKWTEKSKYKTIRKRDMSKYILPSVDCESDNKQIIKMSKKIIKLEAKRLNKPVSKLTDSQKAHAILHYVQKKIKYDDYGDTRRGAVKTLKDKRGNCADQTHLAIALLRASYIPAKYESKTVKFDGKNKCHAWHLAYINGKWLPGESTDGESCPGYGKSKTLRDVYIKGKPVNNEHKISHKFISKFVKYKKEWWKIFEKHSINNKWVGYYGNQWDGSCTATKIQDSVVGGKLK